MKLTRPLIGQASLALAGMLDPSSPADEALSRFFRAHRSLGRQDRAFVAEAAFAVLRRKRSLAAAAQSEEPRALLIAALVRVLGFSGRALEEVLKPDEYGLVSRAKAFRLDSQPPAVRADLPDWLWERLAAEHGEEEAMRIAQALLNPAPLDLRVNLARSDRDPVLARLATDGLEGTRTLYSPAGIRFPGRPAINRHPLVEEGIVEVQDEGSQLLAWLVAPRRGEMVADYCAGAGGKTLALAMLMRGTGRLYAMDVSARRPSAPAPRAPASPASIRSRCRATTMRASSGSRGRWTACWSMRHAADSARCAEIRTSSGAMAPRPWMSSRQSRRASWTAPRAW